MLEDEWYYNSGRRLKGIKEIYQIMKNQGYEVNFKMWRDDSDMTILLEATRQGNDEIVEWLLEEVKVDINEQGKHGFTALHYAVMLDRKSCALILLRHQAAHLESRYGTPLYWAKICENKEMQNLLKTHFNLR